MEKKLGLSTTEVKKLQKEHGVNKLEKKRQHSALRLLLSQFTSPLIYILLLAAVVTFFLHEYTDTAIILLAVFVNTILGFFQENKAQKTLESLNKLLSPKAKVIRNEKRQSIMASELVPGDVVILELGTRVSADGIVIQADSLSINEAILTGESEAVDKKQTDMRDVAKLNDSYQVFMGTTVASGIGKMLVTNIGQQTKMGHIAKSLKETKEPKTPLQKKIDEISRFLAIFVGLAGLLVFVVGILFGHSFVEMFTTSVALAVAAIPEGLVVSLTVILAVGMQRILKRQAVVRKLVAAETLGGVTTICTDKTGTLTKGEMQVVGSELVDQKWGLATAVLCNDQRDPLEIAMQEWAQEQAAYDAGLVKKLTRLDEIPFHPDYKYIATLHKYNGKQVILVSGAPEVLLAKSGTSSQERKKWQDVFDKAAGKGLRIVAFAKKDFSGYKISKDNISKLSFLGVIYFEDPIRDEVKEALSLCRRAGIEVKVITGDYKKTAMVILERLGLLDENNQNLVVEGKILAKMGNKEKKDAIRKSILFSRVSPWQKLEIVEFLQNEGQVVAMTGDGVNDAPALKKADIGIVVEEASDVAKQTADMVLLDSNFFTIVHAVEEGRGIFDNIRKIILYLLSDAFAEVILILGSLLLSAILDTNIPIALTAAQILWINLVSDGFPDLALTVEPKEAGLMQRPPRSLKEPVINSEIKILIALISSLAGVFTLLLYLYYLFVLNTPLPYARTIAFTSLGINSLMYVFSCRNLKKSLFKENQLKNPWLLMAVAGGLIFQLAALYWPPLQRFLNTVSLSFADWSLILAVNIIIILVIEGVKWFYFHKERVLK